MMGLFCIWIFPISVAAEFTPVLSGIRVSRSTVFCVVFCRSLCGLFILPIVLSVLQFTVSDYPFAIFILSLKMYFCLSDIRICGGFFLLTNLQDSINTSTIAVVNFIYLFLVGKLLLF